MATLGVKGLTWFNITDTDRTYRSIYLCHSWIFLPGKKCSCSC